MLITVVYGDTLCLQLECEVEEYCEERLKTKTLCKPTSCLDLLCLGHNETGVYTIYPTGHLDSSIDVFCDQETDRGGWTVSIILVIVNLYMY